MSKNKNRGLFVFVSAVKAETLKFVEEELSNISMPEMKGDEGRFQYTITEYEHLLIISP